MGTYAELQLNGELKEVDYRVHHWLTQAMADLRLSQAVSAEKGQNSRGPDLGESGSGHLEKAFQLGTFSCLAEPVKALWVQEKLAYGRELTVEEEEFARQVGILRA